ncbi:hypothetical protein NEPAR04_1489 [Nematocida parisii]|nr:hypothetical protein NEPAR08_1673 [Nematocida parisii]KAI5129624.1 hypothetical protein NEPAR03_1754 [Nematocida parisii]KAI5142243.1 hypothetical protein NEPAR04_1489 [Nematocida parisii]
MLLKNKTKILVGLGALAVILTGAILVMIKTIENNPQTKNATHSKQNGIVSNELTNKEKKELLKNEYTENGETILDKIEQSDTSSNNQYMEENKKICSGIVNKKIKVNFKSLNLNQKVELLNTLSYSDRVDVFKSLIDSNPKYSLSYMIDCKEEELLNVFSINGKMDYLFLLSDHEKEEILNEICNNHENKKFFKVIKQIISSLNTNIEKEKVEMDQDIETDPVSQDSNINELENNPTSSSTLNDETTTTPADTTNIKNKNDKTPEELQINPSGTQAKPNLPANSTLSDKTTTTPADTTNLKNKDGKTPEELQINPSGTQAKPNLPANSTLNDKTTTTPADTTNTGGIRKFIDKISNILTRKNN